MHSDICQAPEKAEGKQAQSGYNAKGPHPDQLTHGLCYLQPSDCPVSQRE